MAEIVIDDEILARWIAERLPDTPLETIRRILQLELEFMVMKGCAERVEPDV